MRKISEDDLEYITQNLFMLNDLFFTLMSFNTVADENTLKMEEVKSLLRY